MLLEFRQIVEGVDAVQFASVDQAHKQIAYAGPVSDWSDTKGL